MCAIKKASRKHYHEVSTFILSKGMAVGHKFILNTFLSGNITRYPKHWIEIEIFYETINKYLFATLMCNIDFRHETLWKPFVKLKTQWRLHAFQIQENCFLILPNFGFASKIKIFLVLSISKIKKTLAPLLWFSVLENRWKHSRLLNKQIPSNVSKDHCSFIANKVITGHLFRTNS